MLELHPHYYYYQDLPENIISFPSRETKRGFLPLLQGNRFVNYEIFGGGIVSEGKKGLAFAGCTCKDLADLQLLDKLSTQSQITIKK